VRLSLATELCVLLSSHEDDEGPEILRKKCIFYENEHMMGFKLTNTGLQMILDIEVPDTIASHFPAIIHPF
jgi:predicted naringenin-chalcone synthase